MKFEEHKKDVHQLQHVLKNGSSYFAITNSASHNTTRSKSYKTGCNSLNFNGLNRILSIDPIKKVAFVEPKVTMEELVKETIKFGLMPPVVPEFKGITVGGAIMGSAGESSSWRYGLFHDACIAYELLLGDGSLVTVSESNERDLFYGIPGSYGAFGALTMTEIALIPAKKSVSLKYHVCKPSETLKTFGTIEADFLDGLILSKDVAVVIEGHFSEDEPSKLSYNWHAFDFKESLSLQDYLFRYDQGAFWMGGYLLNPSILIRLILEGILKIKKGSSVCRFHTLNPPSKFWQKCLGPWLGSKTLWTIQHLAQSWVESRFIVQDFCIPTNTAGEFLEEAMEKTAIFPLWLCPIKGTKKEQHFAPHLNHDAFINIGMYGIPADHDVATVTRQLEVKTKELGGRKVLYSRSYYSSEEFWSIYSKSAYQFLREKSHAEGRFRELTDKVLSHQGDEK